MMPLSYGMIFHMIYAVLQFSPVSKVDSKPTYFRNHSHHTFLLPKTGWPLWERLGTCLMSYALWIGRCALESVDTEIKHVDNWLSDWVIDWYSLQIGSNCPAKVGWNVWEKVGWNDRRVETSGNLCVAVTQFKCPLKALIFGTCKNNMLRFLGVRYKVGESIYM